MNFFSTGIVAFAKSDDKKRRFYFRLKPLIFTEMILTNGLNCYKIE